MCIHNRLYLSLALLTLLVACGGAGKPTIKLSASPTTLEDGEEVMLSADAKGAQKVEFYKGSDKVGEDGSAPYELKLPLTSGDDATVSFTAKAIAADMQSAISEPVSVKVKVDKEAPKILLAASSSGLNAAGAVTLTASASDNKGVVKVEFFKGSEKLGEDITPEDGFSLVVNLSAEDNGSLKYTAKAYDARGNIGTSAEVVVSVDIDSTAPTIALYTNRARVVSSAQTVTLTAHASDNKGVTRVEFFLLRGDGTSSKIGEDSEAPFVQELSYTAKDNGTYTYTALAYDASGNSTNPGSLSITVDIDETNPHVSLAVDKTHITQSSPALFTATASDDRGLSKVEFYEGSNKLGEDSQAPYTLEVNFTAAHNGTHRYTAKAYDKSGNSADSEPVSISVLIDTTAPRVTLSANPTHLSAPGSLSLTASASDNIGASRVEFFKNGEQIGQDDTAVGGFSYTVSYQQSYSATDRFSARAYDSHGNMAISNTVEVAIDIDVDAPTLSLSSDTTKLTQPGTLNLTAESSDNQAVSTLEFYRVWGEEDQLLAVISDPASSELHSIALGGNDNGMVKFYAKAYDSKGNQTTSNQVSVEVEIKPSITQFGVIRGSLELGDSGGPVSLQWAGQNVQAYSLEVSPEGATATIPSLGNPIGTVVVPPNFTNQVKTYTVTLRAKAYGNAGIPDDARQLSITVAADSTAPTVSLSMEPPGPVTEEGSVYLTASPDDAAGIQKVEFFKSGNPTPFATDTTGPYETNTQTFTAADNSNHTYFARAYDINGNSKDSGPLDVVVAIAPTIGSFTAKPTTLSDAGGRVVLSWTAQNQQNFSLSVDNPTGVSGIPSGATSSTSATVFLPVNARVYTFILTANPFGTAPADSKTVQVTVNPDTTPPTVSLAPATTTLKAEGSVTFTATASDASGIARVEFYRAGTSEPVATDSIAPYQYTTPSYSATDNGSYSYTAKAYDNNGNSQLSAAANVSVNIVSWTQIAAGWYHNCALTSTGSAHCWGRGDAGQLGNNGDSNSSVPVAVDTSSLPSGVSFTQIAGGGYHTCALGSNGRAYCWGRNDYGQLGNNSVNNSNVPVAVDVSGVLSGVILTQIATGENHTCAVASNGRAYCWGRNDVGQLGNGSNNHSSVAVAVNTSGVLSGVSLTQIVPAFFHTCALGSNGRAYCWGSSSNGKLGNNSSNNSNTPVAVDSSGVLSGISLTQLSASHGHSCAMSTAGQAYCWGNGSYGRLGNNSLSDSFVPVAVDISGVLSGVALSQIAAGGIHSCGVSNDSVYCWGYNGYGGLGNGSYNDSSVPAAVYTGGVLSGVSLSQVATGYIHSCALASSGTAYCWGNGANGQLGNGSSSISIVAVRVSSP